MLTDLQQTMVRFGNQRLIKDFEHSEGNLRHEGRNIGAFVVPVREDLKGIKEYENTIDGLWKQYRKSGYDNRLLKFIFK